MNNYSYTEPPHRGRNGVKMRGKKIALVAATVLAVVAGSTFAGTSAQAAGKQKVIGVAVADQKSLFYIAAVDGMKKAAKANNVKLIVLSADNDANKQVGQVNNLITQKVDAIVFIAQDATAAAAGVKAANKAKIPVIAVDQKPQSGNGVLATYIATNSVAAGEELCTWLFKQIGNKGEIGILHGVLGSTAEVERTKGCQNALAKTPGIKVVAEATANWDETQAYKAVQNMLQANPGIVAIYGESDAMGLGAAKAAKDANRKIIAVGIDGFPTMVAGIKAGLTQATQAQVPYLMGQQGITDALKVLAGQEVACSSVQANRFGYNREC